MKFGAMNNPLKPILEQIDRISKLGVDFIEISIDAPEATAEKLISQKDAILEKLSKSNLELMFHLPTFVQTAHLSKNIRDASQNEVLRAIEIVKEFEAKKATIHPNYITGLGKRAKNRTRELGLEFLKKAYAKAEELGIILCVENMLPSSGMYIEPDEFKEIFEKFPNMKFMLDTGHANVYTDRNRSVKFIEMFGSRLGHIHVHDNSGSGDEHLPIGCGNINFEEIIKTLKKVGYDDTITLEIFTDDEYFKLSLQRFKQMWK
jgi:sugar phosphate isomerase/epimerase